MKTMTVGEFKTHFSQVLKDVEKGEKIGITYGRSKEVKALLVPNEKLKEPRKLGILADKGKVVFKDDFKMSEEEFLNL
ncbi:MULTISPECIES: type II toxin-antitoxin system Phd/YefM family antitoxin [Dyadobacter]|uniref:Prevent-host-death protein n=1 Tax=Dyadobacter chenhuakuii TaxID=2909339 RepID=A0ABY4XRM3_9BACT|nr:MULTISPECIES: prevent-host-death protein [Dyadobacter]MCF2492725.1 prevent-host-death protein [Dyadobacter chenhuakuii]MCF2520788.1 prevent-host-death protein [Dyadobacter sp. CY351]USJ32984.1 prevent-host-death protein [Dyadobacter chenhuakuii]